MRDNKCGPHDYSLCMISMDVSNGNMKYTIYNNFTVYRYGNQIQNGNVLIWAFGFESLWLKIFFCFLHFFFFFIFYTFFFISNHTGEDFLFATLNLANATATPIACISKNTTGYNLFFIYFIFYSF